MSLKQNLLFGEALSLDLMFLIDKAVLYVVHTATSFSVATIQMFTVHGLSNLLKTNLWHLL